MEERKHHEFHPNSYPGASPSCSAAEHRPNFSGDAYPNHQQYYNSNMYPQQQQQPPPPPQHYNHDRQFNNGGDQFHHSLPQPPHPVNNEHSEQFGGGGFRSNGGSGGGGFASPQSTPFNVRKRGFHHSGPGAPPDQVDCGHAKLYVVPIPRTATVENIRPLFEQHGNVIEVVLFKDKRTGQQQGSCFVKYATLDDAERAIKALNNRHTFSGELGPIKIKLAEGKRERLATWRQHQEGGGNATWRQHQEGGGNGGVVDKLFVCNVNRQASNNDIEEIFSQFGFVEDIFIVRDEQRQSRGCAFVKFPHREMALAAIKALNGTFTMRGCDHPLIVRYAEPKKPRTGEQRGNYPIAGPNLGPFSQEPGFWPPSSHGVPFGGQILPNAAYPVQQNRTSPNVQAVSQVPIQETTVPVFTQQNPQLYQSPGQMSQMPLHQRQTQDTCPRSSQQTDSETQKQLHMRSSTQTLEQQPILQHTKQESPENRNDHHTVASLMPANPQTATLLECDWSEHTCPDGDKYYYNCVTRQSRWEKPEEFSLFEKQLKNQQQLCNPGKPFQSLPSDLSTQEVVPIPQDLDHVKLQSETSPVIGSICVQ